MKRLKWYPLVALVALTGLVFIASERPRTAPAEPARTAEAVLPVPGDIPPETARANIRSPDTAPSGAGGSAPTVTPATVLENVAAWRETVWEDFKYPVILEGETDAGTIHVVANHLLVTLREGGDPWEILGWAAETDGRDAADLGRGTYLLSWEESTVDVFQKHAAELARRFADTAYVEADAVIHATAEPNDPLYGSQEHFAAISAAGGWSVRTEAAGIVVAVLDSGVRRDHPDLAGRLRGRDGENPASGQDETGNGFVDDAHGWDFVDDNNDPQDLNGHGTHVAGLIGAHGNNAVGVTGVSWDVALLPVRFLDDRGRGTTSDEIRALDYVLEAGVNIVNASFGGTGFIHASHARYTALRDAGIWVVAAAGNDSLDIDRYHVYPASHNLSNIISVGAVDRNRDPAEFSNDGQNSVDLFAPGSHLLSTDLHSDYHRRSGTSQAAAVVSGALALVLAEYPEAPAETVRSRLIDRTRFSDALLRRSRSGGILNLEHALAPGPGRAPVITAQPESTEAELSARVVLSVDFDSSAGTAVQWYFNGDPVAGATSRTFAINRMTVEREGVYHAVVRDRLGETRSADAVVTVRRIEPVLLRASGSGFLTKGESTELYVAAAGAQPLQYQWFRDGAAIPGATSARFVIADGDASAAGTYHVRISNPFGTVESAPIPVVMDPAGELDWSTLLDYPPQNIRRVGEFYLAHQSGVSLYSEDLVSWSPLKAGAPFAHVHCVHAFDAYWVVNGGNTLMRSTDLREWEPWVELPVPDGPRQNIRIVPGGNRMIVYGFFDDYFVVDPEEPSFTTARAPENWRRQDIVFADGAFYIGRNHFGVQRSTDGINWTFAGEQAFMPIHHDRAAGKTVGRRLPGNSLYLRGGSGEGELFAPFGNHVSFSGTAVFQTFPRGFRVQNIVHDFASGDSWTLQSMDWDGQLLSVPSFDFDRILAEERVGGKDILQLRLEREGVRYQIVPPRESSVTVRSGTEFFAVEGKLFEGWAGRIYEIRPDGERIERDQRHHMTFIGTSGGTALYQDSHSNEIYGIGADGTYHRLAANDQFARFPSVYAVGTGFRLYDESHLWLSEDGLSWWVEDGFPDGARPQTAVADGVWVTYGLERDSDRGDYDILFFRRDPASGAWESVQRLQTDLNRSGNLVADAGGFLLVYGNQLYHSPDGSQWTRVETMFANIHRVRITDGVFLIEGRSVDDAPTVRRWFASRNGRDWHGTNPAVYPRARGARLAVSEAGGHLSFARIDGGSYRAAPLLRVRGGAAAQATPAEWRIVPVLEDHEEVVAVELFRDGVLHATTDPGAPRFDIRIDNAMRRTYEVRALYDDGWTVRSLPVTLTAVLPVDAETSRLAELESFDMNISYHLTRSRAFAFRARHGAGIEIHKSADGIDWEAFGGDIPGALYQAAYEAADETAAIWANNPSGHAELGIVTAPGWNEWRPLPKPTGTEAHFGSLVTLDGEIHAVMRRGDLYRLASDKQSWVRVRGIEGFPAQGQVADFFRVFGYGPVYWLRFGGAGSTSRYYTRDFRELNRVPLVDGWHFLGTFSGADNLIYRREDRRAVGFFDGSGTLVHQVAAPFIIDSVSDLGNGTYLAASDGIRWIFGRDGNFFPMEIPEAADATVWRTEFHVVLLGPRGHVTRFAANDFSARSLSVQGVEHGAVNFVQAWLNLRNDGILAMGADTRIRVRASLEPGDGGEARHLRDTEIDVSGMVPGVSRLADLSLPLPEALPLGDYRLIAEINSDGRIPETNSANNRVYSPVFAYNPDVSLVIEPSRFGTVRTDQMSASLPYGTTVLVEAEPATGFTFLGWDGIDGESGPTHSLEMVRRNHVRAHFVPERLLGAFPGLRAHTVFGWYVDEGELAVSPVTAEWSYYELLGWAHIDKADADGAWLWSPERGWLWRVRATDVFYDPLHGEWIRHGTEDL